MKNTMQRYMFILNKTNVFEENYRYLTIFNWWSCRICIWKHILPYTLSSSSYHYPPSAFFRDHPAPRRDRCPFSTLQLSKLNALFESAQYPSWVGSTPLVSRIKWRFELRGNDLADPNNDKCLCMCHAMTGFCGQQSPVMIGNLSEFISRWKSL